MFRIACTGVDHIIGDLTEKHRLSARQNVPPACRQLRVFWIPLFQILRQRDLLRIGVNDREPVEPAILLEDVDCAPVAECRHHEFRELHQSRLIVHGLVQSQRRMPEESEAPAGLFRRREGHALRFESDACGDVLSGADHPHRVAIPVVYRPPARVQRAHRSIPPDQAVVVIEGLSGENCILHRLHHHLAVAWMQPLGVILE